MKENIVLLTCLLLQLSPFTCLLDKLRTSVTSCQYRHNHYDINLSRSIFIVIAAATGKDRLQLTTAVQLLKPLNQVQRCQPLNVEQSGAMSMIIIKSRQSLHEKCSTWCSASLASFSWPSCHAPHSATTEIDCDNCLHWHAQRTPRLCPPPSHLLPSHLRPRLAARLAAFSTTLKPCPRSQPHTCQQNSRACTALASHDALGCVPQS